MMRILILGAGATGGYFGGRLAEAGADVTFLVREARARALRQSDLVITSSMGNIRLQAKTVTVDQLDSPYDLVILGCKAFDLAGAMEAIAPAVGPYTLVLPLLNGLAHYARLDERFGTFRILGGLCHLSVTATDAGEIRHLSTTHFLTLGARDADAQTLRCNEIAEVFERANFITHLSDDILRDGWEKFAFLAAAAAITCLMRASIGAILKTTDGEALIRSVVDECQEVAEQSGYSVRPAAMVATLATLTEPGSTFTASMLRDIHAGNRVEADQIVGTCWAARDILKSTRRYFELPSATCRPIRSTKRVKTLFPGSRP